MTTSPTDTQARRTWQREYGLRLKQARANAGVSQTDLARHLGYARANIANIECGRTGTQPHHVVAAAAYLRVDPGWLLTGNSGTPLPPVVINPLLLRDHADNLARLAVDLTNHADRLRGLAQTTAPTTHETAHHNRESR